MKSEFSKDVYPDVLEFLYKLLKYLGFTENLSNKYQQDVSRFKRVLLFKDPKYNLKNYAKLLSISEEVLFSELEKYKLTILIEPFKSAIRVYKEFSGVSVNLFKSQMDRFHIKLIPLILSPFLNIIKNTSFSWAKLIVQNNFFLTSDSDEKTPINNYMNFLFLKSNLKDLVDENTEKLWRFKKNANPEMDATFSLFEGLSNSSEHTISDLQAALILVKLITLLMKNWFGTEDYISHIILKTKTTENISVPPGIGELIFNEEWKEEVKKTPIIPEIESMMNKLNNQNYQKVIPVISDKLSIEGISTWYRSRLHLEMIAIIVEPIRPKNTGDIHLALSLFKGLFDSHKTIDNNLFNPPMTEVFLYFGMIYIQIDKAEEGLKLFEKSIKSQCFYYPEIKKRIIMDGVSLSAYLKKKRSYLFFRNYGYKETFYSEPVISLSDSEIKSYKKYMSNIYNSRNFFTNEDKEYFLKNCQN